MEFCSMANNSLEGWEESLGENGYMYVYGWIPLLFTWICHNIANRLYPKKK